MFDAPLAFLSLIATLANAASQAMVCTATTPRPVISTMNAKNFPAAVTGDTSP